MGADHLTADADQPGGQIGAGPAPAADRQTTGDRIVMLGTNGGPILYTGVNKPAIALVVGGATYLVDCGFHTAQAMVDAGLGLGSVTNIFLTHHHFDHTSGLPGVALHSWVSRPRRGQLAVWGPPETGAKTPGILQTFAQDIALFSVGQGPFPALTAHDVTVPADGAPTWVMDDANVTVEATRVYHGPEMPNAYAYRFTIKSSGKSVVFSGDTAAPNANLIRLAQGCDVLVHEVQDNTRVDALAAGIPDPAHAAALRQHLYESHSNVLDVPAVAQQADAKTLVFCHYGPDATVPPLTFLQRARAAAREVDYRGDIVAPADLDVIPL